MGEDSYAPPGRPDEEALRALPSVDALASHGALAVTVRRHGRSLVVDAVRKELRDLRGRFATSQIDGRELEALARPEACATRIDQALERSARVETGRALNATGVVLHTGLGRAPLSADARRAVAAACGFAVVEVERDTGRRGHRDRACEALLRELTGAEAATIVNNNAGATLIALAALAAGRPVVCSRGQLVEIGGSFRIPDVMTQSGAKLVEVGTTNRTHLRDYEAALDAHPDAALLLRVHTSNFRVVGFTSEVSTAELVALGRARGVPVMDDLGSGSLVDLGPYGLPAEPRVQESVAAGADLVTFSGDKLLGGPQAGLIVGTKAAVERARSHPLYRALRPDKLALAALEATLLAYRDPARAAREVPSLRMISAPLAELEARAAALRAALVAGGLQAKVVASSSRVGGGSYAVEELPTRCVALGGLDVEALAAKLRAGDPALFARIHEGRLLLDPRTLDGPAEDAEAARLVVEAVGLASDKAARTS